MKKKQIQIIALSLALAAVLVLASCSQGKKLMTLGGQSVSVNIYEFFLSRQKGLLCTPYYYGSGALSRDFWNTTISPDGTTYNDFWTAQIIDSLRIYLVALYLFEEEYDLTLPKSAVEEVDTKLAELLDYDAEGSRTAFNAILSQYGVNYNMLRNIYLLEAKVNYLQVHLYGVDLSLVSDAVKEEYYQNNYVRLKQAFFPNYYYVYETDADGNTIYYDPDTGTILYDSSTGIRKFDESGRALTDKDGKVIYYNEDGSIAYDKERGVPAITFDENGRYKTSPYSSEELGQILRAAEDAVASIKPGDTEAFEKLIEEQSAKVKGIDQPQYPNGYYFRKNTPYNYDYINDIVAKLSTMEVGEVGLVESDYGYHVIMKYRLDPGAYDKEENAEWFSDFGGGVVDWLFRQKCAGYLGDIVFDERAAAGIDMRSVAPNYNY
ncbi:MAG TPA: hypothetical protein GX011_07355 [Clostridiales bacterium]|jgi:hypothetical protein|nr:hypothetical protein [Clostridiales bacterium]